jgi:hypothetical protein
VIFNAHSELKGFHATLSASKGAWVNYDDEKFDRYIINQTAAQRGSELHALASELIRLKVRLPRTNKTLDSFVNDMLGLKMNSEQILYYSENAFGTADGIKYDERKNKLYVFDLKTGVTVAHMRQLEIYVALFCLEYGFKPHEFAEVDLRIYQNDAIEYHEDYDPTVIVYIMDKIITFDKRIKQIRKEML